VKKFYLHTGTEQQGPFNLEELKSKGILSNTPIWYEGLGNWTTAGNVDELNEILKTSAPPYFNPPPEKKNNTERYVWIGIVVVIITVAAIIITNLSNVIPGVNGPPPIPVIVKSSGDEHNSTFFKRRYTVHATVQNQGGGGFIVVTFHAIQDSNDYKRTQSLYFRANASKDLDQIIDDVSRLDGPVTYKVDAVAQ
jgi:hypothetical protein